MLLFWQTSWHLEGAHEIDDRERSPQETLATATSLGIDDGGEFFCESAGSHTEQAGSGIGSSPEISEGSWTAHQGHNAVSFLCVHRLPDGSVTAPYRDFSSLLAGNEWRPQTS